MREVTVTVFQYNELDNEAQQAAREWYRSLGCEVDWSGEYVETLQLFGERFRLNLGRWQLGSHCNVPWRFESASEDYHDLRGVRLWRYCRNNMLLDRLLDKDCPFTGVCFDEDILSPLREFMKRPAQDVTWRDIIGDCVDSFCSAVQSDVEYRESDEYIAETIVCNEYEFTREGKRYV